MRPTISTFTPGDRAAQPAGAKCGMVALVLLVVPGMIGCQLFSEDMASQGKSPLRPASPSADSVGLEIFWARYPAENDALDQAVWSQIDESQIPAPVRRLLVENGLRAGVVGSNVPTALARVLSLERSAETDGEGATTEEQEAAHLLLEPTVTRRRRQLQCGTRLEVQASERVGQMPLLVSRSGELSGRTYPDAQALYAVQVESRADRTICLEVVPEVHYGPPHLRYSPSQDGIVRQLPLRDREVFSDLKMRVTLAPGEMLVVTGDRGAKSRLGHYFHSVETSVGREQKLIVIRLAQVPESQAFADNSHRWPW